MMESEPVPRPETKPFKMPLPVDPTRLLLGFRQKWYWFLLLPLLLGLMGAVLGILKTEDRYSVSLQLLKVEVPGSVQASQQGTAFRPRELSDETLLAVTYASEVMNAVGDALEPPRPGGAVKGSVEISRQRGTDFFYLTAHSRISAEDAIAMVKLWAREIVGFTRELQRREASDMLDFLAAQRNETASQLKEINREILAFSRESEFYDAEKQTESYLSTLESLQMRLAEARIELQSREIQIGRYRAELRNQSPLFEELRRMEKELTFLQGRYTEDNPLVKEKLYEISFLKKQLEAVQSGEVEDLKEFTGSDLGNNLYLEILALENEATQLRKIVDTYATLIEEKKTQVASLPEMQMGLMQLTGQRQQLLEAQSLIAARIKEAEFYQVNPPGYWKIFQMPEGGDVSVRSQPLKAVLLAILGVVGGAVLASLIALWWEFSQPGIRSPLQAAIATRTRPVLHFESERTGPPSLLEKWSRLFSRGEQREEVSAELMRFWLTEIARSEPPFPTVLCQIVPPSEEVADFWKAFIEVIEQDDVPIIILPLAKDDEGFLPELESYRGQKRGSFIDRRLAEGASRPEEILASLRGEAYCFVVSGQRVRPREFKVLQSVDRVYTLLSPELVASREARLKTDVIRTIRGGSQGLILLSPVLRRTIPRLLYRLQMSTFHHQKRVEESD